MHARGQVATFLTSSSIPDEKIAIALNTRLPKDIGIRKSFAVSETFDPRHGAKMKLYRYTIHSSPLRPIIGRQYCLYVKLPLDIQKMKQAASFLIGEHDFTSLSNGERNSPEIDNVRTIERCELNARDEKILIDVQGRSFTYNMVRNITGTLVDVGSGTIKPESILEILAAKDRTKAGQGAPALGLCLEWIRYDGAGEFQSDSIDKG